ncbi:DUF2851 family protein [Carboxylicivirga sp. N1Y90]|uniref:DUF2851 family protein n=1 Tax=Carboxylicivirga fragile TaxID=3417571 RepID=UPI003D32589C|nr:DUF2851 family protein [Marinilabiliaceae bacterium N1Y90]
MHEEFLHFIWQHKLYLADKLITSNGETIEVIHPGHINTDAGPDFFNAKIRINNTLWAGNVEIHLSEDDWLNHQHHTNPAYDNVILHVVNSLGSGTKNSKGNTVPVCRIQFQAQILTRYNNLILNKEWIPCQSVISKVDPFILEQWLERLLIEKLEEKSELIKQLLRSNNNDWDQVFFILLARSFGFSTNGAPFEMMARQTPLKTLLKHADNSFQLEAILFGQGGFLNQKFEGNDYFTKLKKEYSFLSTKYKLKSIQYHLWKFLRLRPSNFPTIRISQLANLIYQTKGQFSELLDMDELIRFEKKRIIASNYWDTHYTFGKSTKKTEAKSLGSFSKKRILFNTILPYQFVYASYHKQDKLKEKIIELFHKLPSERNRLLSNWKEIGINIEHQAHAQSLIFLKNHYCSHKKCLNCHIGHNVLSKSEE